MALWNSEISKIFTVSKLENALRYYELANSLLKFFSSASTVFQRAQSETETLAYINTLALLGKTMADYLMTISAFKFDMFRMGLTSSQCLFLLRAVFKLPAKAIKFLVGLEAAAAEGAGSAKLKEVTKFSENDLSRNWLMIDLLLSSPPFLLPGREADLLEVLHLLSLLSSLNLKFLLPVNFSLPFSFPSEFYRFIFIDMNENELGYVREVREKKYREKKGQGKLDYRTELPHFLPLSESKVSSPSSSSFSSSFFSSYLFLALFMTLPSFIFTLYSCLLISLSLFLASHPLRLVLLLLPQANRVGGGDDPWTR